MISLLLRMLGDMFKVIVFLAFTTKLLAVIHWLISESSVFVKVCNSVVMLLSIKRQYHQQKTEVLFPDKRVGHSQKSERVEGHIQILAEFHIQ